MANATDSTTAKKATPKPHIVSSKTGDSGRGYAKLTVFLDHAMGEGGQYDSTRRKYVKEKVSAKSAAEYLADYFEELNYDKIVNGYVIMAEDITADEFETAGK